MGRGVKIPWVEGQNTMGRGVNIPWVGDRYSMVRGVDIYIIGRGSTFSKKKLKLESFKKIENFKIKKNI
jgi:hypothetical protein